MYEPPSVLPPDWTEFGLVNRDPRLVKIQEEGLCAQTDPELFYPDKGGSTEPAKMICGSCPVRDDCLAWAVDNSERFGVWGGKTERERRKIEKTATAPKRKPRRREVAPREIPARKVCTSCKVERPRSAFYKMRSGLQPSCKDCMKVAARVNERNRARRKKRAA